jgi:signal transduction histidine kinase
VTDFGDLLGTQSQPRHTAQFYEDEDFLVGALTRFVSRALRAGEGIVVVATPPHRDALTAAVGGLGLEQAMANVRALLLDARETLARFMVSGMPDRDRFRRWIGRTLEDASMGRLPQLPGSRADRICAFGEMVDLLWRDGLHDAAIRLEELWGEACVDHGITLLCAYSMGSFGSEEDATRLGEICARHDRVLPADGYARIDDPDARHREIVLLQQRAGALRAEVQKRKELEQALRQALRDQRRAEHTSRIRDQLLAAVAQELRLPLKAILGWTGLLRSTAKIDVREAAETIELSAQAQARVLEDVADASRVVGGTLHIRPGPVDLAFVLRAAVDALAPAASTKGVAIEITVDSDPCLAHADVHRIEQVMATLLSNAVQFAADGGKVEAYLQRTDDEVELTVRDDGCGIEESALPFVFDRLQRIEGGVANRGHGLRLGLAVARHLVELHGGSISAHSEGAGRGSTFHVRLPRRAALRDAV